MAANHLLAELGMVGCGGAGFPTHVKLSAAGVDHLIVNGAECEPLLHKDKEILHHLTADFFKGLKKATEMIGVKAVHIAVKKKYSDLVEHLEKAISDPRISVLKMGDFYPSGDEYELVYEASSRLIPFGGIPLNVGCVVMNAETILNFGRGKPVTTKHLSVGGDVPRPITMEVPLGITFREALSQAGFTGGKGYSFIDGGPMMGRLVKSSEEIVTKTCGGILALPTSHPLIAKMMLTDRQVKHIARSVCDQCTDCTELCPRRLLGYPIQPHKSMRTAQLTHFDDQAYSRDSIFCCECGLCTLFACPEDLGPREVAMMAKKNHLANGVKPASWPGNPSVHPMRSARRVSVSRLMKRLGLMDYDKPAPLTKVSFRPERVRLPLKMHVGVPDIPLVKPGEKVTVGQKIAAPPEGKLGAVLHASIAGRIAEVDVRAITIIKE